MNIRKKSKNRFLLATMIAVAIIIGVAFVFAFATNNIPGIDVTSDKKTNTSEEPAPTPATPEQQSAGNQAKDDFLNAEQPSAGAGKIAISYADKNGDAYQIRTIISDVSNMGTCDLTLTSSEGSKIQQSVTTQNMGSYSVCKGFDIPLASLSKGQWTIRIDFSDASGQSTVTQEATI